MQINHQMKLKLNVSFETLFMLCRRMLQRLILFATKVKRASDNLVSLKQEIFKWDGYEITKIKM